MVIKEILTLCVLMGAIPVSCDIFHMLLISSHSISHCFGTCPHGAKTVWADGWFGAWMLRKGTGSTWLFKKSHIGVWNSHQSLGYKSLKRCLFVCLYVPGAWVIRFLLVGVRRRLVSVSESASGVLPGVCDVGAPTSPGHLYHGGRSDHRASSQADLSWGDGKERALGPGPMDRGVFVGHKEGVADHWFPCTVGVLKKRETHTWS